MKRSMIVGIVGVVSLSVFIGLVACQWQKNSPVTPHPEAGEAVLNYYVSRGLQDGLINGILYEGSDGVIALPAGTWRIRYFVSGQWWQIVVRSQGQACHYIGSSAPIEAVTVQQGTHPSPLAEGLLEPVTVTASEWLPLPDAEELWVFQEGVLAAWITPLEQSAFCPIGAPGREPTVEPTLGPTCGGVLVDGFCWYLSAVNDTCQTTCETQGLAVDVGVDAGGNFWDAHDVAYCRDLLVLLQHPNPSLSTPIPPVHTTYGLCGALNSGIVIKFDGGPQHATLPFAGQAACPCR